MQSEPLLRPENLDLPDFVESLDEAREKVLSYLSCKTYEQVSDFSFRIKTNEFEYMITIYKNESNNELKEIVKPVKKNPLTQWNYNKLVRMRDNLMKGGYIVNFHRIFGDSLTRQWNIYRGESKDDKDYAFDLPLPSK